MARLDTEFCMLCGKQSYTDQGTAQRAMSRLQTDKLPRGRPRPGSVYACPSGNGWHLAKRKATRRAAR